MGTAFSLKSWNVLWHGSHEFLLSFHFQEPYVVLMTDVADAFIDISMPVAFPRTVFADRETAGKTDGSAASLTARVDDVTGVHSKPPARLHFRYRCLTRIAEFIQEQMTARQSLH